MRLRRWLTPKDKLSRCWVYIILLPSYSPCKRNIYFSLNLKIGASSLALPVAEACWLGKSPSSPWSAPLFAFELKGIVGFDKHLFLFHSIVVVIINIPTWTCQHLFLFQFALCHDGEFKKKNVRCSLVRVKVRPNEKALCSLVSYRVVFQMRWKLPVSFGAFVCDTVMGSLICVENACIRTDADWAIRDAMNCGCSLARIRDRTMVNRVCELSRNGKNFVIAVNQWILCPCRMCLLLVPVHRFPQRNDLSHE